MHPWLTGEVPTRSLGQLSRVVDPSQLQRGSMSEKIDGVIAKLLAARESAPVDPAPLLFALCICCPATLPAQWSQN